MGAYSNQQQRSRRPPAFAATAHSSRARSWITAETDAESVVSYGTTAGGPYTQTATGTSDSYTYSSSYTSGLIHHVTLTGLRLNTPYFYVLGAPGAQSMQSGQSQAGVQKRLQPRVQG